MTLTPEGGAAIPVSVTTTRKVQGGAAIPVYGYMTAPTDGRPAMGGSAIPVRVLTAADLKQNGGMWTLEGRPHAMPVYTAPATTIVQAGPAIAVYPVNAWPTVPAAPVVPWVPTDIAGLQLWLKADAGLYKDAGKTQPCALDGDLVRVWADQSGNGRDATQATAAARPLYKVNIQNGLPVVRGDGTDDSMALGDLSAAFPAAVMLFIVIRVNNDTGWSVYSTRAGINSGWWRYTADGNGYMGAFRGARADGYPASPAMPSNGNFIFTLGSSASTYEMYKNGASLGAIAANYDAGNAHALFTMDDADANRFLNGDICEVIAYDSVLSAANRASVETYLNGRWAVY